MFLKRPVAWFSLTTTSLPTHTNLPDLIHANPESISDVLAANGIDRVPQCLKILSPAIQ